jgi:two-component system phosphate regulon sensor histidine kinase PhoR
MLSSVRVRIAALTALLVIASFALAGGLAAALAGGELARALVLAGAVTAGAAALLGFALGTSIAEPLRRLLAAIRAVAQGDLEHRVEPRPAAELGDLADAFNAMTRDLQALIAEASRERDRLRDALDSSVDAVLAVDPDGRIVFSNAAAERLFSRTRDELRLSPFAYVVPDQQIVEALRSTRQEGQQHAVVFGRPNHQYLQVITTPIATGGDWAALAVFHDVSDVKRTEQVRRDFIANVSHELRTPLASIKSVIETLEGGADERSAAEFLARANQEIDRLVQLVQELLELSQIESGEVPIRREPVQLRDVLERAVERMRPTSRRQDVELTLDVPKGLPSVTGDADRLERVAVNLLHNALKFTPAGGSVDVRAAAEDGRVVVRVSDTGLGIAREDLPRVFERFYKVDRGRGSAGTGLGLAIVKHTVEAHGGLVVVESEHGAGSTFSFSLPADGVPSSH